MSEPVLKYPAWQKAYLTALLETAPETMKSKIRGAQAAIQKRFIKNNDMPDLQEQQAITDRLSSLRVLNLA